MGDARVTYKTYVVVAGDTLSSIANKLWGNSALWKKLADANAISAPYTVRTGNTLLVPVQVSPASNSATPTPINLPSGNVQIPGLPGISINIWPLVIAGVLILGLVFLGKKRRR